MHTRAQIALALFACTLMGPAWPGSAAPARAQPAQPAPSELPRAEELFEAYISTIGGQENLAKHRNRVLHGTYRVASSGDVQILTLYCDSQNRFRAELEAPAIGTTVRATNGAVAWGQNISGPAFEITGREAAELTDSAVFLAEGAYKDRYESITTAATADFDGRLTYQVDFVTKSGLQGSVYFDAETKLLVGRQIRPADGKGDGTLVLVKGYKDFEGVKLPTIQQQRFANVQTPGVDIEFHWIEVNVDDLPDFDPPAQLASSQVSGG